jgi:hypothetical protein
VSNKLRFRGNRTLWNDNMSYSTESRVARGVSWLDYFVPEWRSKVSVSELDMHSSAKCVMGQVFDNPRIPSPAAPLRGGEFVALGFHHVESHPGSYDYLEGGWEALQDEWTRVLKDVP